MSQTETRPSKNAVDSKTLETETHFKYYNTTKGYTLGVQMRREGP